MGTKGTLRHKPITQNRESLYLEFYPAIRSRSTMKLVHKEYPLYRMLTMIKGICLLTFYMV